MCIIINKFFFLENLHILHITIHIIVNHIFRMIENCTLKELKKNFLICYKKKNRKIK